MCNHSPPYATTSSSAVFFAIQVGPVDQAQLPRVVGSLTKDTFGPVKQ